MFHLKALMPIKLLLVGVNMQVEFKPYHNNNNPRFAPVHRGEFFYAFFGKIVIFVQRQFAVIVVAEEQ